MHARNYDPNLGGFLSVDPVLNVKRALREPQNWNRYAYVMNNPLKYTDPTGKGLSAGQRINAISNSIIHETVAHRFGATDGNNADQMFFARDSGYRYWDSVRQRYGTVADSYSYADPNTRGNAINGPIPIHPDDQKKLQSILRDEHVEPPDYDN